MHVATTIRKVGDKEYRAVLVRRTFREDGKVKHETVANLSKLPDAVVRVVGQMLAGVKVGELGAEFEVERSVAHGNVAAVLGAMRKLGIGPMLSARPCRQRSLVEAMVAARILAPASKLETTRWLIDTTLAEELELGEVNEDELYEAMDWLLERQVAVEKKLAALHLVDGGRVLYDLSSSYFEGRTCPLAKLGHSRDDKHDKLQIEYGLLTNTEGCPVAIEVFDGDVSDAKTVMAQVEKLRNSFGLKEVILVGDRGMITKTRIKDMKDIEGLKWITALRSSSIKQLYKQGAFQLSLFDERNLAEIQHPDYPNERLMVCRNPFLAKERTRKRSELLEATETLLSKLQNRVEKKRLLGADQIGIALGKVINKYKMAKHFETTIADHSFSFERKKASIDNESVLDGIYIIRSSVLKDLSSEDTVRAYKQLADVEQAFRCIKAVDLNIRPIHHRLSNRVRAHVFYVMLAYYVERHMRRALAPLLFEEEDIPAARTDRDPVAPATRSESNATKVQRGTSLDGDPLHSFHSLMAHMGTIRRDICRCTSVEDLPAFTKITQSTRLQRRTFEMLGVHL